MSKPPYGRGSSDPRLPMNQKAIEEDVDVLKKRRSMVDRLVTASDAVRTDVCSLICPSKWRTDEPQPHHPKCIEFKAALDAVKSSRLVGSGLDITSKSE